MRHQEYKWCRECDLDEQREEEMRRRDYEEHLRAREKRHRQNECCRECDLGEQRKEEKRRRDYQEYVRARQKHHRGYAGCRCRKCDMDDLLRGWAASGGSLIEGQRYRRI